jgi:hypothetical protein
MALQGSGAISFDDLRSEYSNSGSIALGEMYRGGSFVANHSNNGDVPTSGAISLEDFYSQNNTAPSFSTTLTVGQVTGKIQEQGYGNVGFIQDRSATYGSLSDDTIDILSGAFFRQCKFAPSGSNSIFVEIDGGSTSWTSIVINGNSFNRTAFTKDADAFKLENQTSPFPSVGATCTVTINP